MATIHCEIDTETKKMIVKIDKKVLKDVQSFSAYCSEYSNPPGQVGLNIGCASKDDENGLRTYNNISLAEEGKLVREEVKAEEFEISIAKLKLSDADNKKIKNAVSGDDISKLIAKKIGL